MKNNILLSLLLSTSLCFSFNAGGGAHRIPPEDVTQKIAANIMATPINQEVLDRLQEKTGFSSEKIAALATELKRYFILSAIAGKKSVPMFSTDVDELWHAFILFTKEYADFCKQTCGYFVHHAPTIKEEKTTRTPESNKAARQAFIELYKTHFGTEPDASIWFNQDASCHGNDCRSDNCATRNHASCGSKCNDGM